jgi:DNA-binding beta-propeller fold protein YncE
VKVVGQTAYVACGGDFSGNGELVIVDLATWSITAHVAVGGAPGSLTVSGDRVYLGDMLDGRILVAGTDGSVVHDANDPVVICPSDAANNVFQFIPDLEVLGDTIYASCFASDEVVAFKISAGADPGDGTKNAEILGRVSAGDGISALEPWHAGDFVGLANLAGTATHVKASPLEAAVDYWQVGDVPNDLRIEGDLAYVVNSGSNTLQVLDLKAVKTTAELNLGDNANPWSLARLEDGTTAVTLQSADAVAFVDAATSETTQTVAMPSGADLNPYPDKTPLAHPQGIASAGADRLVVSLTNFDASFTVAAPGMLVEIVRSTP